MLYERGIYPQSHYVFKHALTQEAVYQSLLKSTRQRYHKAVAFAIELQSSIDSDTQPEILAYHFTQANIPEKAIPYCQRAGEIAIRRSAYIETIEQLSQGLELVKTLPETNERNQKELSFCLA